MENKKARMKRAQRKALGNCKGDRSFTATYRDDPLCAAMDNLFMLADIWRETLNNPWQREDRAYRREFAERLQEQLRLVLMDEAALEAKYREALRQSEDRDKT